MRNFRAILLKEFRQVIYDYKTLIFILIMPIVLVLLFGYTIKNEINNADIAILDNSRSSLSRQIIQDFAVSDYFSIVANLHDAKEIEKTFQSKDIRMLVVFPPDFESSYTHGFSPDIQLILDASDLNVAATVKSYATEIINRAYANRQNMATANNINIKVKMQYNPHLESAYMFIPGNIALIMIIVTSLMTSITLSKERELGTWRMLAITPSNQLVLVIGKIIPYMCISLICTAIIIVLGILIFHMPMHGSIALLVLLCFLFMLTACSLGILISVLVNTQQVAMLVCMLGFFLPTLLLSGFLFPIENMPMVLQVFSNIIPAKWFIIALRDIMIKGAGLELLWLPVTIMVGLTIVLISLSVWKLSRKNV